MADVATATATKERKILVAVDDSEESMHALSWCLENVISNNSRDTLILIYAKPPRPVYTTLDGTGNRKTYSIFSPSALLINEGNLIFFCSDFRIFVFF